MIPFLMNSASPGAPRLAELRRGGLGAGVPAAGAVRGRHQERAPHGRGLPLPQRVHADHQVGQVAAAAGKGSTVPPLISIRISVLRFAATVEH